MKGGFVGPRRDSTGSVIPVYISVDPRARVAIGIDVDNDTGDAVGPVCNPACDAASNGKNGGNGGLGTAFSGKILRTGFRSVFVLDGPLSPR